MLKQSVPEGLHPMEGTHAGVVYVGTVACRRDPCWRRSWRKECVLWEKTLCWCMAGEQRERSDGDSVKEKNDSPYSLSLFTIWGKEGENLGVKLSLEERERDGRTVFYGLILFIIVLLLIFNNFLSSSHACFHHDSNC